MMNNKEIVYVSIGVSVLILIGIATGHIDEEYRMYAMFVFFCIIMWNLYNFYSGYQAEPFEGTNSILIYDSPPGLSHLTWAINVGDEVTWRNVGNLDHTITADDNSFNSGIMKRGDTFTVRFNKSGNFMYHCHEHIGWMKGVVVVKSGL